MNPLDWNASWPIVFGALFCIVMARANATYWAGRAIVMGAERTRASPAPDRPGRRPAAPR